MSDDYRPIAILSVFSKVYELCVLKQMTEHVDKHNVTNPVGHHLVVKRSISFFTVASYSTVQLTASIAQFTMQ